MKNTIKKIGLFLIPIVLVFSFIEIFYRCIPNDYSIKNKTISQNYKQSEVLIFGNSHTLYGLDPNYFSVPAYNVANISQTLYFDSLLFEKHISKFKKIKKIILNVEYTSLSEQIDSGESNWRKFYYFHYMDLEIPSISDFDYRRICISSTRNFNFNCKLIANFIKKKTLLNTNNKGFGINYSYENRNEITDKEGKEVVKKHEDNSLNYKNNSTILEKIIEICEKRNIEVILVSMPVSNSYRKYCNPIKIKKINATCNALKSKHKNVVYLNLFSDSKFIDDDFYDVDHLNSKGAKKCTKILMEKI